MQGVIGSSKQSEQMDFDLWDYDESEKVTVTFHKDGKSWKAICPWHADHNPSLEAYPEGKKYYCHGCKKSGKFYDPCLESKVKKHLGETPESIFYYNNEKNEPVFQVLRYFPKDFSVRRRNPDYRDGDGESKLWIWKLGNVNPILYRLPELIKGSDPVFIPEGEKHVDALREIGFTATCNPFGAGKWKDEYNEFLKDRDLIILCDNDQPGLEHGSKIASSNYKTAKSIKVPILPNLPDKGDVLDYLKDGGTKESLLEIVEQTPLYNPAEDPNKLHYRIRTIDEILEYPEPQFIIEKILCKETLNIFASYAGVGKSVIALSVAKAILTGQPLWNHFNVIEKGAVLLIDGETPRPFLKERIEKMGFDPLWPFYFIHFENVKIDTDEGMAALNEALDRIKPKVLIIDSFIRIHNVSENDVKDMAKITDRLRKIVNLGIIVILIAHHGKGEDRPERERLRGVSEIVAGVDVEYSLVDKSDGGREGEKIVEFKSLKTRTRPVDPIRLRMTFGEKILVEYEGTQAQDTFKEVMSALIEKKINDQPVSEVNPARVSDIEGWLTERGIKFKIQELRGVLNQAWERGGLGGKRLKTRGKPWCYWPPILGTSEAGDLF
jgi:hypothetical protein